MANRTLEALELAARQWIDEDPDPETRAAALAMVETGDAAALTDCFGARLQFGTAGLRGALGPGPNRMNRALVRRVTAGLASYVLAQVENAAERGVVVGFDGRRGSREFAADAAAVLAGRGLPVYLFDDLCPTPALAHAVRFYGAAAGVMVTASHNPPQDNGYKVYWENGAQIIPPHDEGISHAIDRVPGLAYVVVPPLEQLRRSGEVRSVGPEVQAAYLAEVEAQRVHRGHEAGLRIVYTAMHGVGRKLFDTLMARAGYTDIHRVTAQVDPDGTFPTVKFPNPEEPGAMDLALALAREVKADLVIANDPDADRLAIAVPDAQGEYRALTGNEVGLLLGEDALAYGPRDGRRLVATTIVSSAMLRRIAAAHGADYLETLTGFKWIANRGLAWAQETGGRFVMGYEEALGYTVGSAVRDKDGVSAALFFADLAAAAKAEGRTVLDRLEQLFRTYGLALSAQRNLTLPGSDGAARIAAMMAALRASPPQALGDTAVATFRDLLAGTATDCATGATTPLDLPPSDVLAFDLADGSRVLARPSGTEPKIKFYFEVVEAFGADEASPDVWRRARARMQVLVNAFVERVGA